MEYEVGDLVEFRSNENDFFCIGKITKIDNYRVTIEDLFWLKSALSRGSLEEIKQNYSDWKIEPKKLNDFLKTADIVLNTDEDQDNEFALPTKSITINLGEIKTKLKNSPKTSSPTPTKQDTSTIVTGKITHFYKTLKPRPSEYCDGYDSNGEDACLEKKIKITSHGIGSGIYGLHNPESKKNENHVCLMEIEIKNPFYIETQLVANLYSSVSKALQQCASNIAKLTIQTKKIDSDSSQHRKDAVTKYFTDVPEEHKEYILELINKIQYLFNAAGFDIVKPEELLKQCLEEFNIQATAQKATQMPINILMMRQGFGGMIALYESWNTFSKGCILFVSDENFKGWMMSPQKHSERALEQRTPPRLMGTTLTNTLLSRKKDDLKPTKLSF